MGKKDLTVYIVLFLVSLVNTFALEPLVVTYDKDDYNASSKNWSVAVNSSGLVYIGNHDGLLESDGQSWKLYKLPVGGIVRSVAVDNNDRIYTGSFEEFGYWEADSTGLLHYVSLSDSLPDFPFHNEQIWKIIIRQEKVYFQAFNNVFIYDGQNVHAVENTPNIIFLLEAGNKLIAQSIGNGLLQLVEDRFQKMENTEHLQGAEIKVVMPYKTDSWILGSGTRGLYIWENESIEIWDCEAHDVLKNKQINHGILHNGRFYIGTITDGVYVVNRDGKIRYHLNTANSLLNNTILGMGFDADGNLWLNHDKGLSLIDFNSPYSPAVSKNNQLGAIHTAITFQGSLYLGTNQGLYYSSIADSGFADINLNDFQFIEGSQGQVWDLQIFDDQLICGHNNGTFLVEENSLEVISEVSGGYCIKRFNEDLLIQSTYTNVVLYEKDESGRWQFYRRIDGLIEPIRYIETDFRGNIWASHNRKGIYQLKLNDSFSEIISQNYYGKDEGFELESQTHVFQLDNRIVFTSGYEIFTYDDLKDSIIVYTDLNRQLGKYKTAEKIIRGHGNDYWFILSTGAGLFEITGNQARFKMEMNLNSRGFHLVEESPNIIPVERNNYLICLEDGFIVMNTELMNNTIDFQSIVIREVTNKSLGKRLPLDFNKEELPEIPFNNNSISISFSPVIFPGHANRFSTKLEGLNRDWSGYTKSSSITYSRLPWGEYTFKVRGINEFGKPIPEASYSFQVLPPWYATNLAIAGYILLILTFFIIFPWALTRYFKKQQEAYKSKQEKIFREKQKEQQYLAEQKIVTLQNQQLQQELENKSRELANNTMVIIKRNETLTDIKREIEKQKEMLGSRFPNKNYEKLVRLINKNLSNEEEFKVFEENFDLAHDNFFKRLKSEYPLLTPSDMRLCAFLRLNLSSKEIAPLMNITTRGVEIHRYRLRKKLKLSTDENLVEFILKF